MQFTWLEDFIELARTRSFMRAAENRFVTHPAFGRRIRAIEEWVGVPLIERSKPLALTEAGTVFLDAASNAIEILQGVRTQLQGNTLELQNNLRIATGRTLASTFFPGWYEEAVRRFGFFTASLTTGGAEEGILRLMANEVDLLIVYSSPYTRLLVQRDRIDYLLVARETLVPISALDAHGRVRFQLPGGTKPIPWLTFARALTLRLMLARHLADLPVKPLLEPVYQADSYESILAMAKRGVGLAWLPLRLVQNDVARGELAIVGNPSWQINFDIALYRQRNRSHPVLDRLWPKSEAA